MNGRLEHFDHTSQGWSGDSCYGSQEKVCLFDIGSTRACFTHSPQLQLHLLLKQLKSDIREEIRR